MWFVGTLQAGQTVTLDIVVEALGSEEAFTNVAQVTAVNEEDTDSTPANDDPTEDDQDSDTIEAGSDPIVDLSLEKSANVSVAANGANFTYTLAVTNAGPDTATGVVVTDQLPTQVQYISSNGTYNPTNGQWSVGTLQAGQTLTLDIIVEVLDDSAPIENTAQITAVNEVDTDSTAGNDNPAEDDQDMIVVAAADEDVADVDLSKTASTSTVSAGEQFTYTINVSNAGPDMATGLTVLDELPSGVQFVTSNGNYNPGTGIWLVGDLAAGGFASLTITVEVIDINGQFTNIAEVESLDQIDPDSQPGDNNGGETNDSDDEDIVIVTAEEPLGTIGDYVWHDDNQDGVQDPGETALANVTVTLTYPNGTTATETTDANGFYQFTELPAGNYIVTVGTGPDNWSLTTPSIEFVTLAAGQNYPDADFGFDGQGELGTIGDYVWYDLDGDAVQDADELGIPNVTVTLTYPDGSTITDATDANGLYLFENLPAGNYTVTVGTGPEGYTLTTINLYTVPLAEGQDYLSADYGFEPVESTLTPCDTPEDLCTAVMTTLLVCPDEWAIGPDYEVTDIGVLFDCSLNIVDGCVEYTPLPGFVDMMEEMVITVCNEVTGDCYEFCYNIWVGDCEDPGTGNNSIPDAMDDSFTTPCNEQITMDVLANDTDPDGDALTLCGYTQPSGGSVMQSGSSLVFMPNPGFSGSVTFTYNVCDAEGVSDTGIVSLAVEGCNEGPNAGNDSATTSCNEPYTLQVLSNDTDPNGDVLTICGFTQPNSGSVIQGGNSLIYAPATNFNGLVTFTYEVCDPSGLSDQATVSIMVNDCNDAPIANDDTASTSCGSVIITAISNDSDPNGDNLVICDYTQPSSGSLQQVGGSFLYTPVENSPAVVTFEYTLCDGGLEDSATVTINVDCGAPTNSDPVATDDNVTTDCSAVTINPLSNDADPENQIMTICGFTQPVVGAIQQVGNSLIYTPVENSPSTVSFIYTVCDPLGGEAMANVTIAVNCTEEPTNTAPIATNDLGSTDCGPATLNVLSNDNDADNDQLNVCSITQPSSGSVTQDGNTLIFTPAPNSPSVVSFTYTVCDGNGGEDTATVTMTVSCSEPTNTIPSGTPDIGGTGCNPITLDVLANDSDADGDNLTICGVSQPQAGTTMIADNGIMFTPATNSPSVINFTYTVCDGNGGEATVQVTVTVNCVEENNTNPVANSDMASTNCDAVVIDVVSNDSDADNHPLTICGVQQPSAGTAQIQNNQIVFTPSTSSPSVVTLTYTICDGHGGNASATVTVMVDCTQEGNQPPVAVNETTVTDCETTITVSPLNNDSDPDGDVLIVCSVSEPANGTAVLMGSSIMYTPNDGFSGTETITYEACDPSGASATAVVTVTVNECSDIPGPCESETNACVAPMTPIELCVDFCNLTSEASITDVSTLFTCSIQSIEQNCFVYIPLPAFEGLETITVTGCDEFGNCDTAVIYVTVGDCSGGAPIGPEGDGTGKTGPSDSAPRLNLEVPTGISPNGDGINDSFFIEDLKTKVQSASLEVFDQDGNLVFQDDSFHNATAGWNGINNITGAPVASGSYYFVMVVKMDGEIQAMNGYLNVESRD